MHHFTLKAPCFPLKYILMVFLANIKTMIKKGALLVNTARGGIIDQAALTEHLKNRDFNAALDVYEKEPIAMNDPLLDLENVFMMLHHGGVTVNLRQVLTHDLLMESKHFVDSGCPLKNEILPDYAATMSYS